MRSGVKFVVAAVAAAGLIVAALVVRSRLDDAGAPSVQQRPPQAPDPVVCLDELASLCAALTDGLGSRAQVRIETGESTVGTLVAAEPEFAWVTTAEWIDRANEARSARSKPALSESPTAVAHAPVQLVTWTDRAQRLTAGCQQGPMLCVAEVAKNGWPSVGAPASWGALEFDLSDPQTSAASRIALGALAAEHFSQASAALAASDISSTDIDEPGFDALLSALADSVPRQSFSQADPYQRMLTVGKAAIEFTALSSVDLAKRPIPNARQNQIAVQAIPGAAIEVRIAHAGSGSRAEKWLTSKEGTSGLEKLGYRAGDGGSELPSGGVLAALTSRWVELIN